MLRGWLLSLAILAQMGQDKAERPSRGRGKWLWIFLGSRGRLGGRIEKRCSQCGYRESWRRGGKGYAIFGALSVLLWAIGSTIRMFELGKCHYMVHSGALHLFASIEYSYDTDDQRSIRKIRVQIPT